MESTPVAERDFLAWQSVSQSLAGELRVRAEEKSVMAAGP